MTSDYRICVADSAGELRDLVKTEMAEGWVPLGGVTAFSARHDQYDGISRWVETTETWAQAMVKP